MRVELEDEIRKTIKLNHLYLASVQEMPMLCFHILWFGSGEDVTLDSNLATGTGYVSEPLLAAGGLMAELTKEEGSKEMDRVKMMMSRS
jgi:hypothetical protein